MQVAVLAAHRHQVLLYARARLSPGCEFPLPHACACARARVRALQVAWANSLAHRRAQTTASGDSSLLRQAVSMTTLTAKNNERARLCESKLVALPCARSHSCVFISSIQTAPNQRKAAFELSLCILLRALSLRIANSATTKRVVLLYKQTTCVVLSCALAQNCARASSNSAALSK